ncbi:hypothetical protein EII38_00845 [Streptococcus minor]|uniref:Uncharacterized protein n=1 Tax=Streptococcus minor TaxID=229549 RepID=A0A3P1VDK5_9STRE|nr:hypothetical protein [Streptococcus minor]RRD32312.1 hypothetical protein EII38_00845 [Streptococcus minor]
MKILTINQECNFLINEREVRPEDLSKQDLLELFNTIYELDDINSLQIPEDTEINNIKNPVEKEIVNQIVQKIQEFKDNLEQIKQDIESSFPNLET